MMTFILFKSMSILSETNFKWNIIIYRRKINRSNQCWNQMIIQIKLCCLLNRLGLHSSVRIIDTAKITVKNYVRSLVRTNRNSSLTFFFSCSSVFFFFPFICISWRLITLQYCGGFCRTFTWISHGFTCIPHHNPPSHLPLYPIPLGLPSAPGPSTCLMHPTWAGDLFHPW